MIGQKNNIEIVKNWRLNRAVPRFIIISGSKGSGRFTLAKVIGNVINARCLIFDNSINDVRNCIEYVNTMNDKLLCIFRDCDNMSVNAKNALLKVVEEPPKNAYFIMTINNDDRMLGTIKSRGTMLHMEPYSFEELSLKCESKEILKVCANFYDIQNWKDVDEVDKYNNFSLDIIESICQKNGTKLLRLTRELKPFKNQESMSIEKFMKLFLLNLMNHKELLSKETINLISNMQSQLDNKSLNNYYLVDRMLIDIYFNYKV
jgi:hypothetical protein